MRELMELYRWAIAALLLLAVRVGWAAVAAAVAAARTVGDRVGSAVALTETGDEGLGLRGEHHLDRTEPALSAQDAPSRRK
jgi:hypothetical protein|tara:strand:- start:95 stop:337 length:243 start_codon:yes stop_codon:yes gene_type:complete